MPKLRAAGLQQCPHCLEYEVGMGMALSPGPRVLEPSKLSIARGLSLGRFCLSWAGVGLRAKLGEVTLGVVGGQGSDSTAREMGCFQGQGPALRRAAPRASGTQIGFLTRGVTCKGGGEVVASETSS